MALKYIYQSVKKLGYLFILVPVNIRGNFKVISRKKYSINPGSLIISIIGESHVFQFKNKKIDFTEILAYVKNKQLCRISKKKFLIKDLRRIFRYNFEEEYFSYRFLISKKKINISFANRLLIKIKSYKNNDSLLFEWSNEKSSAHVELSSFTFISYKLYGVNPRTELPVLNTGDERGFQQGGREPRPSGRRGSTIIRVNTFHYYKNESILVTSSSILKIKKENKK